MFTNEEAQFIVNAVNEEVKRTGLPSAGMALTVVAKLQAELKKQANETEPDKSDTNEKE